MKYTLTISDMTAEQLGGVVSGLGLGTSVSPMVTFTPVDESTYSEDLKAVSFDDVDSTGLPWDGRIHSSSKNKNKDGSWKARKNLDEAERIQVESELRAQNKAAQLPAQAVPVYQAPAPAVDPLAMFQQPVPVETPVYQPQVPVETPVYQAPAPVETPVYQPQVPVETPVYQAPAPVVGNTYEALIGKFRDLIIAKKVNPNFSIEVIGHLNQTFGTQIKSINDIANSQPMLDSAFQYINARM